MNAEIIYERNFSIPSNYERERTKLLNRVLKIRIIFKKISALYWISDWKYDV